MSQESIKIENLVKHFNNVKAVDDVSFSISPGEIVGFLGPNGAGKTTTIKCIMGFLKPDSGSIRIQGKSTEKELHKLIKHIGYLPGEIDLYQDWTGKEHIDFQAKLRKGRGSVNELIEKFDFDTSRRIKTLSTGNKQKLGLILALMNNPDTIILDEPTNGLDPLLQQVFYGIVQDRAKQGAAILISSHNLPEVERLCDRVALIRKGKIMELEAISKVKQKKLYTVYVYFDQDLSASEIKQMEDDHIVITQKMKKGIELEVKGDIDYLLKKLGKYKVQDIEIHHANLERVFLEYYK